VAISENEEAAKSPINIDKKIKETEETRRAFMAASCFLV
jgi:hypothetical protein